jgi:glycolate oxidase FAD binding subunit
MNDIFKARDEADVLAFVQWAVSEDTAIEVRGGGSKLNLGRPVEIEIENVLDLSGLRGITLYEPDELVLSAHVGTPLREIETLLSENGQELAFEPADFGRLLGSPRERQTIGGVLATNQAGPRRIKAGAARDHFLGLKGVTGRGDEIKSGGRVVKNVTGYDLCKLMAGSFGTLMVMTHVTVKVLPAAQRSRTILIMGLDAAQASQAMSQAMGGPHEVSAAAHLPAETVGRSGVSYLQSAGTSVTALRIEGTPVSAEYRCNALRDEFSASGAIEELHTANTSRLWREIRDVGDLLPPSAGEIWRVSVTPSNGADLLKDFGGDGFLDWAGGLVWLRTTAEADAIRQKVGAAGHATLVHGVPERRAAIDVLHPPAPGVMALSKRIKDSFDPKHLLNPGRMYREM